MAILNVVAIFVKIIISNKKLSVMFPYKKV